MPGGVKTDVRTYQMYVNGEWVDSHSGKTFAVYDPSTEEVIAYVPDGTAEDVNAAVAWARAAFENGPWATTTPLDRGRVLFRLADKIRQNAAMLAELECRNTGKPIVEAEYDIADAATCFEYYGGLANKIVGFVNPVPDNAVSLSMKEPVGVAGQIIPWNYPLLMAAWKLAPALAAGCTCILKPAEQTPITVLEMANWLSDVGLPPGVVNVVTGFGESCGAPLVQHPDVNKIAFTGSAAVGKIIVKQAADTVKRVTLELGGKSPNIFFDDVVAQDDDFFDKAIEGFVMFALNQGEVCTCPSRALVQESIYEPFMRRALQRVAAIKQGDPRDAATMIGAQASNDQLEKILSYIDIGRKEGAEVLCGGAAANLEGDLAGGYYVQPTVFRGHNKMRIFQEEIFGPVVSVTTFKTDEEALAIANDTLYGLGAGVWSRDANRCYRFGRAIHAGRVWTNCYHAYPAHAAFGGYKQSGIGRETHKMMLDHYQQTKNLLVSYSAKKLGFF